MILQNGLEIADSAIQKYFIRLTNQIYKLLPSREEGVDWQKPLSTLIEEILGMKDIFINYQDKLLALLCKLQGLHSLQEEKDFLLYRRTIFECLGIMNEVAEDVNRQY